MPSKREAALSALFLALKGIGTAETARNPVEAKSVGPGGLIVLRDGESGDPEVYLSPPAYGWTHQAEVVAQVQGRDAAVRDSALDGLLEAVESAIAADPTLGGAVEMASCGDPDILSGVATENGAPIKAARVTVFLEFMSDSPLG